MKKNITLSAEEELIRRAREKAYKKHTTLNAEFRKWLGRYIASNETSNNYDALMKSLSYADSGGRFDREDMNER